MPNFHVGTINASGPTNALAGSSSGLLISENNNRVGLVVTNLSTSTIYLGLQGASATLHAGIALNPSGGTWVMDEYSFHTGQINVVAHSAGNIVSLQEFIR